MSWKEKLDEAILQYIKDNVDSEATSLNSWEEDVDVGSYGGCETCGPEYYKDYKVDIGYYTTKTPMYKENSFKEGGSYLAYHAYEGKFDDLLRVLTD